MSTFDIVTDAPGLLRSESINITLKFDRTGPTTGRVSWNIPTPAAGCTASTQAYCGMLVTLDTKPASADKIPVAGQVYSSDPTADTQLFAGDMLGTSLVVGALYQDRTTVFLDITGLKTNTPYYVSGFPVDCQLRYFVEGVHAYSLDYANRGTDSTHGSQVVVLNSNATEMGVEPTDATGLTIGDSYEFNMQLGVVPRPNRPVDSTECTITAPVYTITVAGADAQTYEELVDAINYQLALLSNGVQGPTAPLTGTYYWNSSQQKLFLWNGSQHVEQAVIIDTIAPNIVNVNDYWLNSVTHVLSQWNGAAWVVPASIAFATDPTLPIADTSFWFNGTNAYLWNGNTWCLVQTYIQTTDPSLAVEPVLGSYWYDTDTGALYKWNHVLQMWNTATAIEYVENPNALSLGTYWFNETTNTLLTYNTPVAGWNTVSNVAISEIAPTTPAPGKYWYNPITQELFQRNVGNTAWDQLDVLTFPVDPTVRSHCDVWWDTITDELNVWDAVNSVWVQATEFYQQSADPATAPTIVNGAVWYNNATGLLYVWENNCFVLTSFIDWLTDPTLTVVNGTVWHNTTADTWYVRTAGAWVLLDIVTSAQDPRALSAGTFWFNSGSLALQQWNGIGWISLTYSVTPLTPVRGALWFDTNTAILKEWNGTTWVAATPAATVELDCNGNLLFTDSAVGSTSYVGITDVTLFAGLSVVTTIHNAKPGTDGASSTPSYDEIGIGTDGSDAVRNALANELRYELGYPVVNVELTKEQIDYAIDRAVAELRQRSGLAYKRGFFFMSLKPNEQRYFLTNKISGMNKIVDVIGVYRLTSSFLSSAHGAGVYGQIVLQHMYNMGTFDLLSYHIMAEYTKLMEILFAARITFTWNEQSREIWLHHRFQHAEPVVCIEATSERTEQDIISDRYAKPWIRRYSAAVCRLMLSEIRGKFSSLPGAGGSISLNAGELRQSAQAEIEACIADIESYVVDKPEEYGVGTQFLFG